MPPPASPDVAVVILNWNGWEDTVACVDSCLRSSHPGVRLLVVDNGSTDGSEQILRERFPALEILQTGENLGFAGGNNAGMRRVLDTGADLVVLLNNDTVVDPGFAAALAEAARVRPDAGMLCSKILLFDEPEVLWYAGASFHPWIGWGRHRGHGQRDVGQFDRLEETDRPTGCALMVTRACCERVGLLRDDYFCYAEDLEWGLRARDAGFALLYVPGSRVWHKVSRSTGGPRSVVAVRYNTRNLLACLESRRPLPWPLRPARWAAVIGAAALGLVTQGLPLRAGLQAVLRGVGDWRHGRSGPISPA
jgi:GT2 family glycosyltransferase